MDSLTKVKYGINLRVLKMHIPAVTDILETASHVAVYDFTPEGTWVKKGIEGTLFLFQRDVEPFYGFFVMNRLDPENLTVLLGPDLETQVLGDYLMYKLPNDAIQGLWIFEPEDRERLEVAITNYCNKRSPSPLIDDSKRAPVFDEPNHFNRDHMQYGHPGMYVPASPVPFGQSNFATLTDEKARHSLTMEEIWQTINGMGPLASTYLTELEFMRRYSVLAQNPLFVRAMYLSYMSQYT